MGLIQLLLLVIQLRQKILAWFSKIGLEILQVGLIQKALDNLNTLTLSDPGKGGADLPPSSLIQEKISFSNSFISGTK